MIITVNSIAKELEKSGIDKSESANEALIITSSYCQKSYGMLRAMMNEALTVDSETEKKISEAVSKRKQRIPLQYILGTWEFMGLEFTVNENVLIPRADTEILCEYIIKNAKKNAKVLDMCTGSGCILSSVLKYRADMNGIAVDLYPDTLEVAKMNLKNIIADESRYQAVVGDATTDIFKDGDMFDVIASNPPYIALDEMEELEPELSHEPRAALTDEGDGMRIIKAVIDNYIPHLNDDGFMIIEHGYKQSDLVCSYAESKGLKTEKIMDYGSNIRDAVIRK